MKKVILASLVGISVIAGVSCEKIRDLFPGIDVKLADVTIPLPIIPLAPANELEIGSFTQKFNLDSIVKSNTAGVFSASDIKSVKVKEFTITVQNPDATNNLANFEYVKLGISSNTNPAVTNITTINFNDVYATTKVDAPVNSPNIISYVSGSEINYNVAGKIRRRTTQPLNVLVQTVVRVE